MDTVVVTIGDWPVTAGMAALGAFGAICLMLLALLAVVLRGNSRRVEEAAHLAAEGLRANFVQQIAERDGRIRTLDEQLDAQRRAAADLQAEGAALRAQMSEQARHAEENLKRFQQARQQMTDEFKLIASEILKSQGETFTKQNREQVDTLLKPLHDKIVEFQTGLVKDRASMGEQIRALAESNLQITTEAHNLTRALKGNTQSQGAWGEMILATILERSGLREGEQYITQTSHAADGSGRVRTDVEVLMPNGDSLVIDSKVSLSAFEAYTNCEEDDARGVHLREHVSSIRGHIRTLGGKEYHRHARSGLDFVLMFVPIEAAFSVAVSADRGLIDFATDRGVIVTTPTTLMSALRTVRNVWDIEKRHQNAEEIAERAGSLYDKVVGFLGSMDKLGQSLGRAQHSYDEAKGQLSSGRGSVVRQIEMLRDLGAKSNKQLPPGWEGDAESTDQAQERRLARIDAQGDD